MSTLPLVRRFPALARMPRVALGNFPTPVQRIDLPGEPLAGELWIKRDDLTASPLGGNKVRALEFLLAGLAPGEVVLTAGGEGSTHVLTTATYARALGGTTRAVRWRHDMNPSALDVAERARAMCARIVTTPWPALGLLRAHAARRRAIAVDPARRNLGARDARPRERGARAGGADRARRDARARARRAPGGQRRHGAGLALGFAIAGLDTVVVGARVAPRIAAGRVRVLGLAERSAASWSDSTGERLPRVDRDACRGSSATPLRAARTGARCPGAAQAEALREATGLSLDGTYSAKAFSCRDSARLAAVESTSTLFLADLRREKQ